MSDLGKNKKIITNTIYTMGGLFLLNGVLQLAVYPLLNKSMGSDLLGSVLFLMGVVGILCPSIGQALNNSRLVVGRTHPVTNGDYDWALLIWGVVGSIAALVLASGSLKEMGSGFIPAIFLLLILTIFRYYADVEYRLNLNYKQFFIYYLLISVGYLVGFLIYRATGFWCAIFLTGEAAGLLYVGITGNVFKRFWMRSANFKLVMQRGFFLTLSYLVTNLTLNIDRLALKGLIGNVAVTKYYVVSLIGKTLVLLIAPVNTIVISYLTKQKNQLSRRQFLQLSGIGAVVSAVFFGFCVIATPVFIRIFYGDLYIAVKRMIVVVSLSQILGLLSAFLFILVLTFADERWQLGLQLGHLVILLIFIVMAIPRYGILGFSWAVLAANALRILAVFILGMTKAKPVHIEKQTKENE